jgi:hypothetical protein
MLEAMARISPLQPNEAMARITLRRNGTISLDPIYQVKIPEKGSLVVDSKFTRRLKKIEKRTGLGCSRKG